MPVRFVLHHYVKGAMGQALYDEMEDGSYRGRIPACGGVVAFAPTLGECEDELRSTLEDWVLLGPRLKHKTPPPRC
ncbi:MAG TPA: type II toxin-antitoxin system HicB family antitoxin [Sumerlaeia bacterium]|nr:type II toxin-antitoxin system HicB family antitoxin [Sumerlaeia bacterium]